MKLSTRRLWGTLLISGSVFLVIQQMTFFIWRAHRLFQIGDTSVETVATWDWPLTVVLILGQVALLSVCSTATRRQQGGLLLLSCILAVFYLTQLIDNVGTSTGTFQGIIPLRAPFPHTSGVLLPSAWWQENRLLRQAYLDPSFPLAVCLGGFTILLSAYHLCRILGGVPGVLPTFEKGKREKGKGDAPAL
jgi:hypothetical protein